MRLIGHVKNEASAKALGDYLTLVDIRNQVESDDEGWAVWILSEDQMEAGRKALREYLENPGHMKYQDASQQAALVEAQERREKVKFQKRYLTRDQIWRNSNIGRVTLSLIVISVMVTLIGDFSIGSRNHWLVISEFRGGSLPEVRQGQVWRLLTPIFIHLSVLHLLFNMFWLRDFGSVIEARQGWKAFLGLVIIIGIGSNLGQYWLDGPLFGGMSGVLYGLFGYIWMRGHFDPASGLYLQPVTVWTMLIWFFLCWSGLLGNVANWTHTVGLAMGMAWGAAPGTKRFL